MMSMSMMITCDEIDEQYDHHHNIYASGLYFVAMNYTVHSIMYGYFCLQALKMVMMRCDNNDDDNNDDDNNDDYDDDDYDEMYDDISRCGCF